MSRDQRFAYNHTLLAAQVEANRLKLPLTIVFFLRSRCGHRSREQYEFMLRGLRQLAATAQQHNISFHIVPADNIALHLQALKPAAVFTDQSPLRGGKALLKNLVRLAICPVYEVDTHNIIPVWLVSDHQEYAARTLRPKIHRLLSEYAIAPHKVTAHSFGMSDIDIDEACIEKVLAELPANGQQLSIESGEAEAQTVLAEFISRRLEGYAVKRNDPSIDGLSGLSPYLHFGQLSSLQVVLAIQEAQAADKRLEADAAALIEEIVVRKELSDNFCFYNEQYDQISGAPDWAQRTLIKHASDKREFVYTKKQLEDAQTHDEAWNAAQRQLTITGKMHGYMRMYWAKKVLEWTKSPEDAIKNLIYLNDFYSLDGGDPNGYVGILWSVANLHDRPWNERAIFGTVRYMNYGGLKRKFSIEKYIAQFPHN